MDAPITKHITTKATTNIATGSAYMSQIVYLCSGAGTTWSLKITDKASTPRTWFGPVDMTIPSDGKPIIINFTFPMYMEGGIDVITGGTTAGVLDIQIV